jgi:hypothetical protein
MRTTRASIITRTTRTKAVTIKSGKAKPQGKRKRNDDDDVAREGDDDPESETEKRYDSDALDEDSGCDRKQGVIKAKSRSPKENGSPSRKRRKADSEGDAGDGFDGEVVGKIVKAPTTGRGELCFFLQVRQLI